MKKFIKWTATIVALLAVGGLLAFLYNVPPLFLIAPETFSEDMKKAAPPVEGVADPAQRAMAAHGRELVMGLGCTGCHATNGPQGPDLTKSLAGGGLKSTSTHGTYVGRNLTPDPETGLARRTDDEAKRVLQSGTFPDGRVTPYFTMPWSSFSHLTEEDRHAVVVYLRSLPAVKRHIPDMSPTPAELPPGAVEGIFGLKDYGIN